MTDLEVKACADRIRSMQDFDDLVKLCKSDERMALFCGVKCDTSDYIMRREVIEQWNVCRKK